MNSTCEIRETTKRDFENLVLLWNNGAVMSFVGFPDGLGITLEEMDEWLAWAINKPNRCHYSIYANEIGYCGETFYNVDSETKTAALDIKLLPTAQGKSIAKTALKFAINKAFDTGKAERVYVDPHPDNHKAWVLYEKLGFTSKPRPKYLHDSVSYLEITKDEWSSRSE